MNTQKSPGEAGDALPHDLLATLLPQGSPFILLDFGTALFLNAGTLAGPPAWFPRGPNTASRSPWAPLGGR